MDSLEWLHFTCFSFVLLTTSLEFSCCLNHLYAQQWRDLRAVCGQIRLRYASAALQAGAALGRRERSRRVRRPMIAWHLFWSGAHPWKLLKDMRVIRGHAATVRTWLLPESMRVSLQVRAQRRARPSVGARLLRCCCLHALLYIAGMCKCK